MIKNIINIGFIILCAEPNIGSLKYTIKSIKANYRNSNFISIVPKTIHADDLKEYKECCPTYKGKDTITSLINAGFKNSKSEWNVIIMEGAWMSANLNKKYSYFHDGNIKDIFFPIVCDYDVYGKPRKIYNNFWDCSLNGLTIHQKTFKEVGNFCDNPLEISRLMWALKAQEIGCSFKSILGAKIC